MRKFILVFLCLFSLNGFSGGLPVIDVANLAEKVKSTFYQIKEHLESVKQTYELIKLVDNLVKQVESLDGISDWVRFINSANNVISHVNALDGFDNIPRIPIDTYWITEIEGILRNTHNMMSSDDYIVLLDYIMLKAPQVADRIIKDIEEIERRKMSAMGGMYYVSSHGQKQDARLSTIENQNNEISGLGDLSLGKSANLANAQMLLMNQQMEEVIKALHQQISNQSAIDLYRVKEYELMLIETNEYILNKQEVLNEFLAQ